MSALHLHEVSKIFALKERQVVALEDISIAVKEQEFVSIVGPSGCGKSTLLLLTAGLESPTAGRIVVDGRPVIAPITDVGIVFQRDVLFDWRTIVGNVMLQADIRRLPRGPASRRPTRFSRRWGWWASSRPIPGSYRVGCDSASRSAARFCTMRRSC